MKSFENIGFGRYISRASSFVDNKNRARWLLKRAVFKSGGSRVSMLRGLKNLKWIIMIFRDWLNGSYRQVSRTSMLTIAAALLYFVAPVDLILDYIPLGGFIDDAAVIAFVLNRLSGDVESYKLWRKEGN